MEASDGPALVAAANDGELWRLPFTIVPSHGTVAAYIGRALGGRDEGHVLPYVIVPRATGDVIGTTRFWKIDRQNRKVQRW